MGLPVGAGLPHQMQHGHPPTLSRSATAFFTSGGIARALVLAFIQCFRNALHTVQRWRQSYAVSPHLIFRAVRV